MGFNEAFLYRNLWFTMCESWVILFNNVKDSHILYAFTVFYLLLFIQGFFINTALKKSFARYKRYLHLKRKRADIKRNS